MKHFLIFQQGGGTLCGKEGEAATNQPLAVTCEHCIKLAFELGALAVENAQRVEARMSLKRGEIERDARITELEAARAAATKPTARVSNAVRAHYAKEAKRKKERGNGNG